MATFPFDQTFTATATAYRDGDSYVMKGTMFRKTKAVEVFEARGATIVAAEDAARMKAEEIWQRLKSGRRGVKAGKP